MSKIGETTLRYNAVVWISSLSPEEDIKAQNYADAVKYEVERVGASWKKTSVRDVDEFSVALSETADAILKRGLKPIIHLDMHGNERDGFALEPSGEFCSWNDAHKLFQKLNREMKNSLVIVAAVCFGMRAIMPIKMRELVPFHVLIAPEKAISLAELFRNAPDFYFAMLDRGSLTDALTHLPTMKYFHCERMLAIVLANYAWESRAEPQRSERIEKLLQEYRDEHKEDQREDTELRGELAKMIDNSIGPSLIAKYADNFLFGAMPSFDWDEVEKIVPTLPDTDDH